MLTSNQLRTKFFNFFKSKDHKIVESSSLIPHNDPSLLFNSAGMVPFKDMFLGRVKLEYTRAASIQKCVRTTDIENIGITSRHHTFFEMMGNFSFGDYFKKEAIEWAWEFLTKELSLPKDKLYVSIYKDDEEAFGVWKNIIAEDRIYRLAEDSNFWMIGDTGPSGPCSEILFDKCEEFACDNPNCAPGCDCDRYLEVWNLVFTEFDRQEDGSFKPLPKKNIDTGMGFERLLSVVQNVPSGFETDIFKPVWDELEKMVASCSSESRINGQDEATKAFRIICDHMRSAVFLIADGVFPANDGRGYVLKRLIRRAIRQGNKLGLYNFLEPLVLKIIENMKEAYPYLLDKKSICVDIINQAEKQFGETVSIAEKKFKEIVDNAKVDNAKRDESAAGSELILPIFETPKTAANLLGSDIFKLFDTYGMPLDLIKELAEENGLEIDEEGFEKEMEKQRERARENVEGWAAKDTIFGQILEKYGETEFVGYEQNKIETEILDIVDGGIILKKTPFYGESGGQKGDKGIIKNDELEFIVKEAKKPANGLIVHFGKVQKGEPKKGLKVVAEIDVGNRDNTRRNHTATHLLQAVLREQLGAHVEQSGSYVTAHGFRFDFTHPQTVDTAKIERKVNEIVQANYLVDTKIMTSDEAKKTGALAFFGEKYGETVRVVSICISEEDTDDVQGVQQNKAISTEFCGGMHVNRTGNIGLFKITAESSIASGVRRIEGITGMKAYEQTLKFEDILKKISGFLKVPMQNVYLQIEGLFSKNKELEKELEKLKNKLVSSGISDILAAAVKKDDVSLIAYDVGNINMNAMRHLSDQIKAKFKKAAIFLIAGEKGNYKALCSVTKNLAETFNAKDILNNIAAEFGGGGGGRPDMAQAGIKSGKLASEIVEFAKAELIKCNNLENLF